MKFPNLKAEIARKGLTVETLSLICGISYSSLSAKLAGRRKVSYEDALKIKNALGVDVPLETLFAEKAV
jgi:transcriptional regulator with XRE-family HTH domain